MSCNFDGETRVDHLIDHIVLSPLFLALASEHIDERLCLTRVKSILCKHDSSHVIDHKGGLNQVCILDSHITDNAMHVLKQLERFSD